MSISDYIKLTELGSKDNFIPSANDTMLLVTRPFFKEIDGTTIDIDTIKKDDLSPSIKLPLDAQLIENILINDITESDTETSDTFNQYFRGLLIEPIGAFRSDYDVKYKCRKHYSLLYK